MAMGTGKTKVALDLIASKAHKVDYILWVCPYALKTEIEAERLKWHPEITLDVVGCESISGSDRIYMELIEKMNGKRCFMVVDESLKIKNREAKRTERILRLGESAEYRLILNGTPISKNVLDLWTQMQFLSPKILKMSYTEFKNTYCEYYLRGNLRGKVKKQYNIEHLISLVRPYIFDCELDIDAGKNYVDYAYSMSTDERGEYEQLKTEYLNGCMGQLHDVDFFAFSQLLQSHYCRSEAKQLLLQKVIDGINEKVIVFVKYLHSIPGGALCIVGSMNTEQRKAAIERFRTTEKVLYITYGCGSYGLNLQFCRYIIFAEHSFDYALYEQAAARIYRLGQENDVTYISLWCEVGLEHLIRRSRSKKADLLDEVKKEIERTSLEEWARSM